MEDIMSKILIIEDELDTARLVKDALALESIEADIAKDGQEGIQLFEKNNYDLILLDLKMPKLDGEQVLKEIRKNDPFIDVIIYTNFSEFADIKRLTNIGIQGYINKGPQADLKELINAIMSFLSPIGYDDLKKLIEKTPQSFFKEGE